MISKEDVVKEKLKKRNLTSDNREIDISAENRKLLKRFDPEDDRWDRRALFEVTGLRLHENDFLESDTSDEETQALNRETRRKNHLQWLARKAEIENTGPL